MRLGVIAAVVVLGGLAAWLLFFRSVPPAPPPPAPPAPPALAPQEPADAGAPVDPRIDACDAGDSAACRLRASELLGIKGISVAQLVEADHLFQRACEAGDAEACVAWGSALWGKHQFGPDNVTRRALAYEAACRHGSGEACTSFGFLGNVHPGMTTKQQAEAFVAGCELGDGTGCLVAADPARWFKDQLEPEQRRQLLARAHELLEAACAKDDSSACSWLGYALATGAGTPPNPTRARQLYLRACALREMPEHSCAEVYELDRKTKKRR